MRYKRGTSFLYPWTRIKAKNIAVGDFIFDPNTCQFILVTNVDIIDELVEISTEYGISENKKEAALMCYYRVFGLNEILIVVGIKMFSIEQYQKNPASSIQNPVSSINLNQVSRS